MNDPTGGWAKATEKTGEATAEAIKAARDMLSFVADPLKEIVGMATDSMKVRRFQRQIRLSEQLRRYLRDHGLEAPSREIPLNFSVPLIEYASLEEDDELQDVWARMLANAADASSKTERRTAFLAMLKDMTTLDVKILALIHNAKPLRPDGLIYTGNFPDSGSQSDQGSRPGIVRNDVSVSLNNLSRLGCLDPSITYGGLAVTHVRLTPLGRAFILSCTSK
ncbi:MAG: DUF4393 domain-containing protein [Proteobacteria bacterium]|nr:DUF4393 domain-containing protein [Pseudomonadota bacterium]